MNMTKLVDYVSAGLKVAKDKIYDYAAYYGSFSFLYESSDEEKLTDYDDIIDSTKYADENGNRRIRKDTENLGLWTEYSVFFGSPTCIIDNIYLGSAFNAASREILDSNNIKVIINMTKELSQYYPDDYEYAQYELYDNNKNSILQHLDSVYQFIVNKQEELLLEEKQKIDNTPSDDSSGDLVITDDYIDNVICTDNSNRYKGNILIHCYMGASRSASIVIYYLMKSKNYDFDEALDYIIKKRPHVNPTFKMAKDLAKSTFNDDLDKSTENKDLDNQ
jgi:protein-tyrosine phosphatase